MRYCLLVLDDQIQYGRSLERALRREFEIVLVANIAEAKEKLSAGINVVLSDIRLDESNPSDRQGLEFIQWLRSQNATIPIIAMSALDSASLEQDALSAGATKFLRKPIVVSQLKMLLQQLTEQKV